MKQRGFTLVELVIVVAIVGVLASAALPLARWSVKRTKEYELQQNLRIIRNAIDRYHDAAQAGLIEVPEGESGYPPSLDVLVEGVQLIGQMPPVLPGVSDEYGATGPGLTGGLQGQLQGGGFGGAAGGPQPGAARGFGGGGQAAGGFGSMSGQGSMFGSGGNGRTGGSAGGMAGSGGTSILGGGSSGGSSFGGGTQQGGATFGSGSAAGGRQQSGAGSSFGSQTSLFDRGSSLSPGGTAEPLLGPDGQPVKLMFLRRLPVDPFTGKAEWGMRCYGEPPTDSLWCGRDVFDIYSKSIAAAIDGSKYKDW